MNRLFLDTILKHTGAKELGEQQIIQNLWSGYGKIVKIQLIPEESKNSGKISTPKSVVVKHISLPREKGHPRGWNTDISHQRKLKSYEIETEWYQNWNHLCGDKCRAPESIAVETYNDEVLIVMEDMDAAGYPIRKSSVSWTQIDICLRWLANFHATFLGKKPEGLWKTGTYWHLETRPDELEVLSDIPLKEAASTIDKILKESPYQTIVHGDAKLANFCFSKDGESVSAVDFQYVGGGCGMKDVVYFVGSCLYEDECEELESDILNHYFKVLREALIDMGRDREVDLDALERDWRELYPVAWTDFHRFLKGWSPDHWKINSYSEKLSRRVLEDLI